MTQFNDKTQDTQRQLFIVASNTRDNIIDAYNSNRWGSKEVNKTWDNINVGDYVAVYLSCNGELDMTQEDKDCGRGVYMLGQVKYKHSNKHAVDTKTWGAPFKGLLAIEWLNRPGHSPIMSRDNMRAYVSDGDIRAYGMVNLSYTDLIDSESGAANKVDGIKLLQDLLDYTDDLKYFGQL